MTDKVLSNMDWSDFILNALLSWAGGIIAMFILVIIGVYILNNLDRWIRDWN